MCMSSPNIPEQLRTEPRKAAVRAGGEQMSRAKTLEDMARRFGPGSTDVTQGALATQTDGVARKTLLGQ